MTDQGPPPREHWSFDKRIPLATIAFLFVQTFTFGWWASGVDGRLGFLEQSHQERKAYEEGASVRGADLREKISTVATEFQTTKTEINRRLERIEDKLDRALEVNKPVRSAP